MLIIYSIVHFSLLLLPLLKKYWPRYPSSWQNFSEPGTSCHSSDQHRTVNLIYKQKWNQASRAVKKILSSRLVIKSRRLWNSHQRYKFLRAEASRDILKLASEMAFQTGFQEVFPLQTYCCFMRIHATLGTMPSKCLRRFPRHRTVRTSLISKPV